MSRWMFLIGALAGVVLSASIYAQVPGSAVEAIDPFSPQVLSNLSFNADSLLTSANAAYQAGEYETAAKYYIAFLRAKPQDPGAFYNLACCYGLLGNETFAADALLLAYRAGFEDLGHIRRDPDFEKVRGLSYFSAAMDSIQTLSERKSKSEGKTGYYPIDTWVPYRVYYPEDFDQSGEYNLLVGLHGFGDTALNYGYLHRLFKDRPLIYLVPEAPFAMPSPKEQGYSWSPFTEESDPLSRANLPQLESALLDLVASFKQDHRIRNTWLLGFSQGCSFAYKLGLRNPDTFSGLLAFGGWLDEEVLTDTVLEAANGTRVFIGHGTGDRVIEFKAAEEALAKLETFRYPVRLFSYEGSHRIDKDALIEGLTWLEGK